MADTTSGAQPARKRARQACLACNARRVKCNVTEQQPCHTCIAANIPCETRESRRGKHPRPSKKRRAESGASLASDGTKHADELAASHVLASLRKGRDSNGLNQSMSSLTGFTPTGQDQDSDVRQEDDGDVFLGESTTLRYVPEAKLPEHSGPSPSHSIKLRHSVPNAVKAEALVPPWEIERRRARINFLRSQGAFSFPAPEIVEGLLQAYFRWFHPCFAIVDEMDIWEHYKQNTISPLLLQAMLFIGILHCEEPLVTTLGLGSRHQAKYMFYNHAKDIYDAEYETKKITVIQSLFLMSFWRAGALLEKDTRHWLGSAITLAQSRFLHRSTGVDKDQQPARLRRRIWWALYTRDRQCAAALGLPNRIRDEDCDFEPLKVSDFEYAFHPAVPEKDAEEYASYGVAMSELATMLGRIVHSGYLPNKTLSDVHRTQMREELVKWKLRLPPAMQPDSEFGSHPSFHANMQHLAYNNLLILLYRLSYIGNEEESNEADGNVVLHAAARNSKIIEDMLSDGNLRHGQIHVITNLFNTLCIHTVHLQRSDGTTKKVAEHRAKLCLLGLQELQKTWEVTNWLLQLFFQYLDRNTAVRLRLQTEENPANSVAQVSNELMNLAEQANANPRIRIPEAIQENEPLSALTEPAMTGATNLSWSSEEANQWLFSRIEDEFGFGEGEIIDWGPDENAFGSSLFANDVDQNFLP